MINPGEETVIAGITRPERFELPTFSSVAALGGASRLLSAPARPSTLRRTGTATGTWGTSLGNTSCVAGASATAEGIVMQAFLY